MFSKFVNIAHSGSKGQEITISRSREDQKIDMNYIEKKDWAL